MTNKKAQILLFNLFIICVIIGSVLLIRLIHLNNVSMDGYCEYKYGENFFGSFKNEISDKFYSCIKVYENGSIERYYFSEKEYFKNCKNPPYWNFRDWRGKCG